MSPLRAQARSELLLWPLILHSLDEVRQHVLANRDALDAIEPHQRAAFLAAEINRRVGPDTVALLAVGAILTSMEGYQTRHHFDKESHRDDVV